MCMCVLPGSVHYVYAMPVEARRGPQILRSWSYRWLRAVMWVKGTKSVSFAKVSQTRFYKRKGNEERERIFKKRCPEFFFKQII